MALTTVVLGPSALASNPGGRELLVIHAVRSSLSETTLHANFGIEWEASPGHWETQTGLNCTRLRREGMPDRFSGQSIIPLVAGTTTLISSSSHGDMSDFGQFLGTTSLILSLLATNLEYQVGWEYLRATAGHQFDLFLPGWSPREKIALGVQAGQQVRVRLEGFRSFSGISQLNGWGGQARLMVPIQVHWL